MELKITPAVKRFYKQLASTGGKARAAKYDKATLSRWARKGGRPRQDARAQGEQGSTSLRAKRGRK
jgi:hypothetical protein